MRIGIVIIGRNEGVRLQRCLESVVGRGGLVIYVDSGSSDGSVALAEQMGAVVVDLDGSLPFSAARARNAGFERLMEAAGGTEFVQFVDGDCEISRGWLERAGQELQARSEVAAVCGRLRERHPDTSIYNRLCDIEWNSEVGEVTACGGIAMFRVSSFQEIRGFDPSVVAGEEPELCVRLRQQGHKIVRSPDEMGWHDAAMMRLGQWRTRTVRAGYAFALGAAMHGRSPQRHWVRETRSIWWWGLLLPLVVLGLTWPTAGWSLAALLAYPLLTLRVYRYMRGRGFSRSDARLYAAFCVLAKFPQVWGQIRYMRDRLLSRPARLIEYKQAQAVSSGSECESPT